MADTTNYALKEIFDRARFQFVATELKSIYPPFDSKAFLDRALVGLDDLSLMQRMRRMTETLRATLPKNYRESLRLLKDLAPRLEHNFVAIVLADFVGLYGSDDFDESMDALRFFTQFGSGEFAVREFLRRDLKRTLAVMEKWSRDENEHVRRLASEGSRPRLPWSFRIEALVKDPQPTAIILENLRSDPSLYVRKSVANHLNDITKDHPEWVLQRLKQWPMDDPRTAWIAKRALRTLIKKGDRLALAAIGAGETARVTVKNFTVKPRRIRLSETLTISTELKSSSKKSQRLIIDYVIHYIKKSGPASGKVFKWKEATLAPTETLMLSRSQTIRDFTTRSHHPGRHVVELMINGAKLAKGYFELSR